MNNRTKWIQSRVRTGWVLLALGALVGLAGIYTELQYGHEPINYRILTAAGILLAGAGAGCLAWYWPALKDEQSARRLSAEERDERTLLLSSRAGNRAYWVSAVMVFAGLMWASFASNGSLPPLAGDALWNFLAAAVLVPFGVYLMSYLVDEKNS